MHDGPATQVDIPRPHPVYGIVLKREEIVSVELKAMPSQLGSVLAAVAAAGYDLLHLSLSSRGLNLKLIKVELNTDVSSHGLRRKVAERICTWKLFEVNLPSL